MNCLSLILLVSTIAVQHADAPPEYVHRDTVPPSSTLQALIDAAEEGAVVTVPSGRYPGFLRLSKGITLQAEGLVVLDAQGKGDVVEITAAGTTLRGFTIFNSGIDLDLESCGVRVLAPGCTIEDNKLESVLFGIDAKASPNSVIRNNRVGGKDVDCARRGDGLRIWKSDGVLVESNVIHDGRDSVIWYSRGTVIRNNVGVRCRYGLHLMYSHDAVIEGNELRGNSVGIYLMYSTGLLLKGNRIEDNRGASGYGIGFKEVDNYRVVDNVIAGNCAGIYMDESPFHPGSTALLEGNTIAQNTVGLAFLPNVDGNEIVNNYFLDNVEQVRVQGKGEIENNSFIRNERGNYWSDYVGYDIDGDGIGEYAHEPSPLYEQLMDREPKLRAFLFSPAQEAIEFVARALPAVRPAPKFVDDYPQTQPPLEALRAMAVIAPRSGAEGERLPSVDPTAARDRMLVVAATLLWVSAAVCACAFLGDWGSVWSTMRRPVALKGNR